MKKIISALLVLSMLLSSTAFAVNSNGEQSEGVNLLQFEDVADYIDLSDETTYYTQFGPAPVVYYWGDNYTVVDDPNLGGYYLITYAENGKNIAVNGVPLATPISLMAQNQPSELECVIGDEWSYFGMNPTVISLGGIAVSALVGLLVPAKVPQKAIDAAIAYCVSAFGESAIFPNAFCYSIYDYQFVGNIDAFLGIYEMLHHVHYWIGTRTQPTTTLTYEAESVQTRYS